MQKNGYLKQGDVLGKEKYQTADGSIVEGTKILIRELEVEGLILRNVEASVSSTLSAPLLLGQSAISRFGKFEVDYSGSTLKVFLDSAGSKVK